MAFPQETLVFPDLNQQLEHAPLDLLDVSERQNWLCIWPGLDIPHKKSYLMHIQAVVGWYTAVCYIIYTHCEAPKIAKLVYNSNNYGL